MTVQLPKYTLSKSDFKLASTCPMKLYYKKLKYPMNTEDNEYLQLLQEGGYMVGKLAQLQFPNGIEVKTTDGTRYAIEETTELLKKEDVVLFEPAIYSDHKLIRIDILVKTGNHFDLIEVKSKSVEGDKHKSFFKSKGIGSKIKPYIEDVAFQTLVLREAFPNATVTPHLMLVNTSAINDIEELIEWFQLKRISNPNSSFQEIEVEFTGDKQRVINNDILMKIDVSKEVNHVMPLVEALTKRLLVSIRNELLPIPSPLTKGCADCEFKNQDTSKSGYHQCLGTLAEHPHHVFDLYRMGNIRDEYITKLLKNKKCSMFDVPVEYIGNKDGDLGTWGNRRMQQINAEKSGVEFVDPELTRTIKSLKYPLHFIDFETSTMAIPYHKGMSPYEDVAFQWSCHTIEKPGMAPKHAEWINVIDRFPNFEFAESLMNHVGTNGSVLIWSQHENKILKGIFNKIEERHHDNPDLVNWLSLMVRFDKNDVHKMHDMCKWAQDWYMHPEMKGSASIKAVLPAIWNNTPWLHEIEWFKPYVKHDSSGKITDPYHTLPEIDILGSDIQVKGGTDAIRAYQEMMYGASSKDESLKDKWRSMLLEYCKLDTLAMVVIWEYWRRSTI